MNVSLTPELERLVNEKVESGLYQTASEVVREGLRLVEEREAKLRELRATIEASIAEGGGPMKISPASAQACAKPAFSDRKP